MVDYVRSFNPVWTLVDLVGTQCDDTFYLYVLQNQVPYYPALVYHTPTGTPWTTPYIQLQANGTLPVDVYWDPDVEYRLELRQAVGVNPPSQSDPLIYLIENYIPNGSGTTPEDRSEVATTNQITNAQFSLINFISPYVLTSITNPDPIEVAPGWFLELTGNGNVEIERTPLNDVLANPTNAPYALRINLTGGWTGPNILRQRLQQNGMLWANKFVSVSYTGRIEGTPVNLVTRLVASNGMPIVILSNKTITNEFDEYKAYAPLPDTVNPDVPPAAYIDFQMLLPSTGDLYLTSFQLIASGLAGTIEYEQDAIDRQIDHTFHYYKDRLIAKPIPSYLVGWDFPLNPAQFEGDTIAATAIGADKSKYVWDQTIIFQSEDSGVDVSRATSGGITLEAAVDTQMAMIQYLDQVQAREILSGNSAVALKVSSTVAQTMTLSLYASDDANLPDVSDGSNDSIVATLGANGSVATNNGVWIPLSRNNPGNVEFSSSSTSSEIMFSGFSDNIDTPLFDTATFFAIVIGTNTVEMGNSVTFDWVSLCAGDIATRPAPKTFNETLLLCQEFYWKTFSNGDVPAQSAGLGSGYVAWVSQASTVNSLVTVNFSGTMRAIPELTLYNPISANAFARNVIANEDCNPTAADNITEKRFVINATSSASAVAGQTNALHVTADARLGLV